MRVLVVNAGSSSLKLRVLGPCDELEFSHDLKVPHGRVQADQVRRALEDAGTVDAVGHRVVHGGTAFREPVLVDEEVVARLRELTDLAPLHQPKSLEALAAVSEVLPGVPAVACFDTAFHADMPPAASTYAIPPQWRQRWALRKYGFHGLSHAWAARRAAGLAGRDAASGGRSGDGFGVVTAHLGAGASLAAVLDGRSVDTTMGFTPLDGLVMATRSGSLDPGLVLWLQEHVGTPAAELAATLEHRSGLLGLAGSADMREILVAAGVAPGPDGDTSGPATTIAPDDARLALDVYLHRLRADIGAMAAALGGLDALVFTGGVGERSPEVRRLAVEGLGFLGLAIDDARNADGAEGADGTTDRDVSAPGSPALTLVVESREDLEIARSVRALLDPAYSDGLPEECRRAA